MPHIFLPITSLPGITAGQQLVGMPRGLHPKNARQALGAGAGGSSDAAGVLWLVFLFFFLKLRQEDVSIKRPSGSEM